MIFRTFVHRRDRRLAAACLGLWLCAIAPGPAAAHLIGHARHDHARSHYDFAVKPPMAIRAGFPGPVRIAPATLAFAPPAQRLTQQRGPAEFMASIFRAFAPQVQTRADAEYLYVESNSMPAHRMMVGITAWQQQVPLPQPYTGANAWRLPLQPVVARTPLSARDHFFRGAIALAANGVPIFNPIKNDGRTDTFLAGELDEFGGHCGRADDYHYHIAPTHLQSAVGADRPVAFALDGYAIYGFTEPGAGAPGRLDEFNGHTTPALGYHYHATRNYPYLNGGFHGEVREQDGQVDPQPRAGGVRPALPPLRGATITGFTSRANKAFSLTYEIGGETRRVNYVLSTDGTVRFDFVDGRGGVQSETYLPRGNGGGRPPREGRGGMRPDGPGGGRGRPRPGGPDGRGARNERDRPPPENAAVPPAAPLILSPKRSGRFQLTSPAVADGAPLPLEFTGDGIGVTPPLQWKEAPAGTQSFALVMDHLAPDNVMKSYWVQWDIPAGVAKLPKNAQGVGKRGATSKRGQSYVPPHSAGPGKKTYTITIYAPSAAPRLEGPPGEVTREALLAAIRDLILDSAELKVTYTRPSER